MAHNNRGLLYAKKGEFEKGLADLAEAIRLEPRSVIIITTGARFICKKAITTRLLPTYGSHSVRSEMCYGVWHPGAAYLHKEDDDKAVADLTEAIRLNPKAAASIAPAAQPTSTRANMTKPLPTARKPSGSIRALRRPITTGARHSRRNANSTSRWRISIRQKTSTATGTRHRAKSTIYFTRAKIRHLRLAHPNPKR